MLKRLTKMVVEVAPDEEMNGNLGYKPGNSRWHNRGNSRNGKRANTVTTDDAGPVEIEIPATATPASSW